MKRYLDFSLTAVLIILMALSGCVIPSSDNPSDNPGTTFTLTVAITGEGTVVPGSGNKYAADTIVSLKAIAANGYYMTGWSGANGSEVKNDTIIMNGDKTITAEFSPINPTPPEITVYTGGQTGSLACYWTGSTMTTLGISGQNSQVYAIYVSDGHVYSGGTIRVGDENRACYWVDSNTTPVTIGPAGRFSFVTAITVSNGTVYAAGHYVDDSGKCRACYWVGADSYPVTLGAAGQESHITAITVVNGIVYTGGDDGSAACYWTNSAKTTLSAYGGYVHAIAVSGGHVYTGGTFYSDYEGTNATACYWVDQARTNLRPSNENSAVYALTVADGHVYTLGNYNGYWGYWTDDNQTPTATFNDPDHVLSLNSIFVFQGHVFCIGSYNPGPTVGIRYFVDGDSTPVTVSGDFGIGDFCHYATTP